MLQFFVHRSAITIGLRVHCGNNFSMVILIIPNRNNNTGQKYSVMYFISLLLIEKSERA